MSVDWNWVTGRLATGGALSSPDDAQSLAAAGITHVLDVTDAGDDAPFFVGVPGVQVIWNPTADDGVHPKPLAWFAASLAFALPAFAQPHAKVYAHCSAGVNRGPSTALCIMVALGWTPDYAEIEIRAVRPQVGLAYKNDAVAAVATLGYT